MSSPHLREQVHSLAHSSSHSFHPDEQYLNRLQEFLGIGLPRSTSRELLQSELQHLASFRPLGEPDLGALLMRKADFDLAAAGSGEVSLTRDQTIIQGAPSCTFRYKFAPR